MENKKTASKGSSSVFVLFNNKCLSCLQGGFQGTFSLTPEDSPFQLSPAGILTVRNSTLLDRERVPSIHLQVLKTSLLLSKVIWGQQVRPDLSWQEAEPWVWISSFNWRNKSRLWQQCYLEGNTTADTVSSACNSHLSFLLLPQNAFEQHSPLTALFLQVTARDHLPPNEEVNSTINIVLLDENDNSPTFRDTPYRRDIFLNMTAGMAILQVLEKLSKNDVFDLNACMSLC